MIRFSVYLKVDCSTYGYIPHIRPAVGHFQE